MNYDAIVIGGGPGGYGAAVRLSQLGKNVALFEKDKVGGTCLNRGCIPTKTLMHSASVYSQLQKAEDLGISVGNVSFAFDKLHQRKSKVQDDLRSGMESLLKANKVDIIFEEAKITAPGTVEAAGETYAAESIVVAVGSKPSRPGIPGLDLPGVVTSDEILETDTAKMYDSLVIIGGGVIGVELGSLYSELGCKVTIIEALDRIVANLDREISQNLTMIMKKRGVSIFTGASVQSIAQEDGQLTVNFQQKGKDMSVTAQGVLAAMGRKPLTEAVFAGVTPDMDRGYVLVDDRFQSSVPGVYAIGDAIGGIQLAHKAEYEGMAVAECICGKAPDVNTKIVPSCVYTTPEIAAVGITADQAKAQGIAVKTGKFVMGGNAKTVIEGGERGFVKLVFSEEDERLLGAHIMCERATDMIGELATAVVNGLHPADLDCVMRPHPSFCEAITEAVEAAEGRALHAMPRK